MNRLVPALAALIAFSPAAFAETLSFDVKKTASCGCCQHWIDYIKAAGHKVEQSNMDMGSLAQHKMKLGITPQYASCHTATVEGYVIEGHVPVEDIVRLLEERARCHRPVRAGHAGRLAGHGDGQHLPRRL
jgi:hypothetical protein